MMIARKQLCLFKILLLHNLKASEKTNQKWQEKSSKEEHKTRHYVYKNKSVPGTGLLFSTLIAARGFYDAMITYCQISLNKNLRCNSLVLSYSIIKTPSRLLWMTFSEPGWNRVLIRHKSVTQMESMQNENWVEIEMSDIISLVTLGYYVLYSGIWNKA
jgi:hypothetical protein